MNSSPAAASRLNWLRQVWDRKTDHLSRLKGRAAGLTIIGVLKPKLAMKLSSLIDQIARLRHQEDEIVSEITAIEQRHHFMRKAHKLRRASPVPAIGPNAIFTAEGPDYPERDRTAGNWLGAVWLWLLIQRRNDQQNQSPKQG